MADGVQTGNSNAGQTVGWALARPTAPGQAADAGLRLATGIGSGVRRKGKCDAAWRVRPDGILELARTHWGRVELLEVHGDGTSQLAAASPRSWLKLAEGLLFLALMATFAAAIFGGMAGLDAAYTLFVVALLLLPLLFVHSRPAVRPWVRERFGSDMDWADVPARIEGTPTTGNQAVALADLAGDHDLRYRVAGNGTLEVVKIGKNVEVLSIDEHGVATSIETLPRRHFELHKFRPDVTWHYVHGRDTGE